MKLKKRNKPYTIDTWADEDARRIRRNQLEVILVYSILASGVVLFWYFVISSLTRIIFRI